MLVRFFAVLFLCCVAWATLIVWSLIGYPLDSVIGVAIGVVAMIWMVVNGIVLLYDSTLLLWSFLNGSYNKKGSVADRQLAVEYPGVFCLPWAILTVFEAMLGAARSNGTTGSYSKY